MKRVTRSSVIAVVAASGAVALGSTAYADSGAAGAAAGSPGVGSGNTVQLPLNLPVNACGNTVDVVGLLNPSFGNSCASHGHGAGGSGGSSATSSTQGSPGVVSGNGIQLPVDLPVNVTGNSVNVVGIANPVFGNESVNGSTPEPVAPPRVVPPKPVVPETSTETETRTVPPAPQERAITPDMPVASSTLAHTGSDGMLPAAAGAAILVAGGIVLRRRYGASRG